jgi:hypothetical protein
LGEPPPRRATGRPWDGAAAPRASPAAGLALAAGVAILGFVVAAAALAQLRAAVGGPPWPAVVPLACTAATALFAWAVRRERPRPRTRTAVAAWAAVLVAFGAWTVCQRGVFDGSYDGQNYHAVAVLLLLDGWNPLTGDVPIGAVPAGGGEAAPIRHFPKGAWLAGAGLAALAGSFEAAKAFTLLLIGASLALLGAAVALRRGRLAPRDAVLVLLAAANPVAVKNLFTHMVDGQLAAVLTCLAALLLVLRDRRDAAVLAGLAFAAAYAVNLKFTGLVFAAMIGAGGVAWHASRGRSWAGPALALAAGLAIGSLLLGWAPYVRNAREHGHPFHPLSARSGAIPRYTPPNLRENARVEKLVLSIVSETDARPLEPARPKLPFVVRQREIRSAASYDTRLGGFGPVFALELVLLAGGLAHAWAARRRADPDVLAIAGLLLATSALFPEPWWARWIPQLWTVPLLAALALEPSSLRRGARTGARWTAAWWLDAGLATAAAANVAIAAAANGARVAVRDREIRAAHRAAAAMPGPVEVETLFPQVVQARLAEAGVGSVLVPEAACADPVAVPASHTVLCPASRPSVSSRPPLHGRGAFLQPPISGLPFPQTSGSARSRHATAAASARASPRSIAASARRLTRSRPTVATAAVRPFERKQTTVRPAAGSPASSIPSHRSAWPTYEMDSS